MDEIIVKFISHLLYSLPLAVLKDVSGVVISLCELVTAYYGMFLRFALFVFLVLFLWILVIIVISLLGKRELFALLFFGLLMVMVCSLILLVLFTGFVLCLWLFLDIFYTIFYGHSASFYAPSGGLGKSTVLCLRTSMNILPACCTREPPDLLAVLDRIHDHSQQ